MAVAPTGPDRGFGDPEETLRVVRLVAAALATGVPVLAGVLILVVRTSHTVHSSAAAPAALAGLIAPVIGYRIYRSIRGRLPAGASVRARLAAFRNATLVSLAVTDAVAMLGIVVHLLTRDWTALTGVATHLLLAGAVWPTRARLDDFLSVEP